MHSEGAEPRAEYHTIRVRVLLVARPIGLNEGRRFESTLSFYFEINNDALSRAVPSAPLVVN